MSQQINLLREKDRSARAAAWGAGIVGVALLALVAYYQSAANETSRMRETVAANAAKLAQLKTSIQALQTKRVEQGNASVLEAEIAAMRPRAEALAALMKQVRSGRLGNPEGYSRYLQALGNLSQEGLWLTGVSLSKDGAAVSISGRALHNESVMQYARRLNEVFAPYGVQFNSLDLTPEAVSSPTPGNPVVLKTVAFKLS
jgi:hypothetical protein